MNTVSIRQWQKNASAAARAGRSSVGAHFRYGEGNEITLAVGGVLRPNHHARSAGVFVANGRDILEQHSQHPLVSKVLRLDDERDLSKALAVLARRYGANTPLQEAMTLLVAELLDLCGCALPDATDGDADGDAEGGITICKPPEEQPDSSDEERKKDTDEVDGSTQTGDETHGGDSASGEVPDGQSQSGAPQDAEGEGEGDAEGEGGAEGEGDAEGDAEGEGDAIAEAQKAMKKSRRAQKRQGGTKGRGGSGVYAEFDNLDRALVRRARAALASLVSSGASEYSPRYDHTALVKRLVSHRSLQPARREEAGRPCILVVADVSGSCSSFAKPACDVAQACGALGVAGADIVTVRCYNVWRVEEVRVNNRPIAFEAEQISTPGEFSAWIARTVGGQIEVVIGLGDSDEYTTYESFALLPSVERMIWLDNYGSNMLENTPTRRQRIATNWRGEGGGGFAHVAQRKLTYMVGCGDAAAMVKGLEMSLRGH